MYLLSVISDDMDPMLPVFATQPQDRDTVQKASKATIGAEGGSFSDTSVTFICSSLPPIS